MDSVWAWTIVAGLGVVHGLSPASGWMFAAACGVRDGTPVWRTLRPIALGHALSIAIVACAFAQGLAMDRGQAQSLAGASLIGVATYRWLRCAWPDQDRSVPQHRRPSARAERAGMASWSFLVATAHGSGLMLVPALMPLCMPRSVARELAAADPLPMALAAVSVHVIATLATTGIVATAVARGLAPHAHRMSRAAARQVWTTALAITGAWLLATR